MSSHLSKVQRGIQKQPVSVVVYGGPGSGKSTFAAATPNPVFLDFEGRTGHLDCARLTPTDWASTLDTMRELAAGGHDYRTLVIDTLDHMEVLMHRALCSSRGWVDIEAPGYGKGYVAALQEWGRFMVGVDVLRGKGMHVVMLAHGANRTAQNPTGDDYDVYALKLKGGPKTNASDFVCEKADFVGYAHFEDLSRKVNKADTKGKALTTGERRLTFAHHPAYQTKAGRTLTVTEMPLQWSAFAAAVGL